jgi:MFS family permease
MLTLLRRLWLMYWLNYLDRNAIALAKINDIQEDLNLSGTQYQTCVSILFVGYILGQIPSNMLLTRVRPSWYMAAAMGLWAIVSTLTAVAKDFKGLFLTRFFLGVTEAPYVCFDLPVTGLQGSITNFHLSTPARSTCSQSSTPAKRSPPASPFSTRVTF